MAGIIDGRHDGFDELDTEEIEDTEVVDNDEGFDFEGGQDEDVDADLDFEEESEEETEDVVEETEESNDLDELETEEEENDGKEDEEIDQEETQVSEKDAKIAELERQRDVDATKYKRFENQVKETLERLGITVNGDVMEALDRTIAETEGKTLAEYRKERDEKEELENARKALVTQKFEKLAADDLAELKKSFPNLLSAGHITKCFDNKEDFLQFGKLRDAGVSPKNAYMAVNGDKVRTAQAQAAQQKVAGDGKRHITSVAPKKASDNSVFMPKQTLAEWRDNFPELSDKEIRDLYRQTL